MNPLTENNCLGLIGELLVQLRLLEYSVQAAPPLQDSGNDLIAIRDGVFRAIQVKTTKGKRYSQARLPERYDILAVVQLIVETETVRLDESLIFLIPKEAVPSAPRTARRLEAFRMTSDHVNFLFSQ
jgi:hypothetical protein